MTVTEHTWDGINGFELRGWLAAIGVLRAADIAGAATTLRWDGSQPVIALTDGLTLETVCDTAVASISSDAQWRRALVKEPNEKAGRLFSGRDVLLDVTRLVWCAGTKHCTVSEAQADSSAESNIGPVLTVGADAMQLALPGWMSNAPKPQNPIDVVQNILRAAKILSLVKPDRRWNAVADCNKPELSLSEWMADVGLTKPASPGSAPRKTKGVTGAEHAENLARHEALQAEHKVACDELKRAKEAAEMFVKGYTTGYLNKYVPVHASGVVKAAGASTDTLERVAPDLLLLVSLGLVSVLTASGRMPGEVGNHRNVRYPLWAQPLKLRSISMLAWHPVFDTDNHELQSVICGGHTNPIRYAQLMPGGVRSTQNPPKKASR